MNIFEFMRRMVRGPGDARLNQRLLELIEGLKNQSDLLNSKLGNEALDNQSQLINQRLLELIEGTKNQSSLLSSKFGSEALDNLSQLINQRLLELIEGTKSSIGAS